MHSRFEPRQVFSFPARSVAGGRAAQDLFGCVADALRELLPIDTMARFDVAGGPELRGSIASPPRARAFDELEQERKRHTQRLRADGHYGRPAGALASGVAIFANDDPHSHYARLFVHAGRPLAQQYLGALLTVVDDRVRAQLSAAWSALLGPEFDGRIRNVNYCPPAGFIPWHTNRYDAPGWRLYLVDVPHAGAAAFAISDGARVHRVPDRPGWFNLFRIEHDRPLWHCVGSEAQRVSCGVRLTDAAAARLLARARAAGAVELGELP